MIQSFVRPRKNVRQRALWNDVLSRQSDTMAISIVEEHPELRVHWERMMSCSVLVLPYDPQRYRRRGSGIALEAAAAGVPYVASAGTSLCDFLEGGNGEAATDDRDFAEKISKILRNYPTYQDAARRLTKSVRGRLANDPIVRALQPVPSRWPVETVG